MAVILAGMDKGVRTFPIMKVIAWLEVKLANFEAADYLIKTIDLKNNFLWLYSLHPKLLLNNWGKRGVQDFPKKNVTRWLEFERTYIEDTVQHFCHYAAMTPPQRTSNKVETNKGNIFNML